MIYIASPFFDEDQLDFIMKIEAILDANHIPYYSPRTEGNLSTMCDKAKQRKKHDIYMSNVLNIKASGIVIAVIDGRDTGTIWEMGYASGQDKRVISLSGQGHGINIMLAESVQAHLTNLDDLMRAINDKEFKGELVTDVY